MKSSKTLKLTGMTACLAGALALAGCGDSAPNQIGADNATPTPSGYNAPGDNSSAGTNGAQNNGNSNGAVNGPVSGNAGNTSGTASPANPTNSGPGVTGPATGGGGR